MMNFDKGIWFVHLGFKPPLPLKLEKDQALGAIVVGGKTGSHRTGHGETYWDKFVEIIKMGYVPVDVAQELQKLPFDWLPPQEDGLDGEIKKGAYRKTTN